MGDVLSGTLLEMHDAELHIERPDGLRVRHREYCPADGQPKRHHRRDQLLLQCHERKQAEQMLPDNPRTTSPFLQGWMTPSLSEGSPDGNMRLRRMRSHHVG
jgi:hypothetical protein